MADIINPVILMVSGGQDTKFAQLINGTLTEVTEEDLAGNTKVNDYAFYRQVYLTRVTLPDTITEIGASAFAGCSTLQNISFPSDLAVIGSGAFGSTPQLKIGLFLKNTVQVSGNCYSWGFKKIKIGGLLYKTIPQNCFQQCPNLEIVELNEGVTTISTGRQAQYSKSGITFVLPKSTITIGNDAWGYSSISKVILKATTPPTIGATNNFYMPYYVPYNSIGQYKSTYTEGTFYPLVSTVADLTNIDTATYTKACVEGNDLGIEDDNNYAIYNYTNGEWVKV